MGRLLAHIEDLAPGLVILGLLASRIEAGENVVQNEQVLALLQNWFVSSVTILAFAYLLGVAAFAISRLVVDTVSELAFRPQLLKLRDRNAFAKMTLADINDRYRSLVRSALVKSVKGASRREFLSRRRRGRLVRSLLVPTIMLTWPVGIWASLAAAVGVTLLYAVIEVSIYEEAKLIMG